MAAPTRTTVLSLYKQLMKESKKITDYNFRMYAVRKTRDSFKENKNLKDAQQLPSLVKKAEENLEMLKRQALISQLYGTGRLVIESQRGEGGAK